MQGPELEFRLAKKKECINNHKTTTKNEKMHKTELLNQEI